MFKFFRSENPRDQRSVKVAATTPTIPPGGNLDRTTLKTAMKYREDNNLSGNFFVELNKLGKKAQNIATEIKKGQKILDGLGVTKPGTTVVVKPPTANYEGNTTGIPLGSGIPEPQISNMTATDTPKEHIIKRSLLPIGIGAAAVGIFLLVTRKK